MSDKVRELIYLTSPALLEADKKNDDGSIVVKGFASVEMEDRAGDIVPPEEFNIDQFMASPSLLVNHNLWRDNNGNRIPVGRPKSLHVAKLERIKGDGENFAVKDVETKEIVSTFPRKRIPNLRAGDSGLFVFVEVSQPEVVKMVERGELSAFSWRGLAHVAHRISKSTREAERFLSDIDLYEISLVNVPENPNSTFMVGKSSALLMKLDKEKFEDGEKVVEYLKTHSLEHDNIFQKDGYFYCRQLSKDDVELDKICCIKMADGVDVIVGPLKEKESVDKELITDIFDSFSKGIKMSDEKKEVEKTAEEQEKEIKMKAMSDFATLVATKNAEVLKPSFDSMAEGFKTMTEAFKTLSEKSVDEKEKEEKEEPEKENVSDQLKKQGEALVLLAKSVLDSHEKLKSLSKATGKEMERDEKIDTKKSADDPNDCLGGIFPFLS